MKTIIEANILAAIREAKRSGITAMSLNNLFQITSTRNVHGVSPGGYRRLFEESAPAVAERLRFQVYS